MQERRAHMSAAHRFYVRKFKKVKFCVYCGDTATTLDHVYPISKASLVDFTCAHAVKALGQGLSLVPCCSERNTLAQNEPFIRIRDKRKFVQRKIKTKYSSLLNAPVWTEEELSELAPALRQSVEYKQAKRDAILRRLRWPHIRFP